MVLSGTFTLRKLQRVIAALACAGSLVAASSQGLAQQTTATGIQDGTFQASGKEAGEYVVPASGSIGPWRVELGNVGLHVGQYATPVADAGVIDLNGNRSGSLYQAIDTIPGATYTVRFHATGNWRTLKNVPRLMTVRFGAESRNITMTCPPGWSTESPMWQEYAMTFVARGSMSAVRFTSASGRMPDGALITNVQVIAPDYTGPGSLDTVEVPLPSNLADFVVDREAAVVLGKALFWDMQVGSDNRTACATCHWNAGADTRHRNALHPGAPGGAFGPQVEGSASDAAEAGAEFVGVNKLLRPEDFPFFRPQNPLLRADEPGAAPAGNPVLESKKQVGGSAGVTSRQFVGLSGCCAVESSNPVAESIFSKNGAAIRQVTSRNSPSIINAVFHDRTFWDGRANHYFNGVNPFGDLDPGAKVYRSTAAGKMKPVSILLNNASLASQAVGPVISSVELSAAGRLFPDVGRKLFALRPLAMQRVSPTDSVLGSYMNLGGYGLKADTAGYMTLIRKAFRPEWWNSSDYTDDGYTQMEMNFSLFWGLSVMLYEATLVSDDSAYDRYARGDTRAMSPAALEGLRIFNAEGRCINCHHGPEFAGATVSTVRAIPDPVHSESLIEQMLAVDTGATFYDSGFYNIGVRPTREDIGVGASHPKLGPLSYTRQEQLGDNPDPHVSVPADARISVMGAFKTPTLRNIELTGPYMHNGSMKSLEEVLEFYTRGGNFPHTNQHDLHPDISEIPELQSDPGKIGYVVEFLRHLTDERVRYQAAPFDHPQLFLPLGHGAVEGYTAVDEMVVLPETGRNGGDRLGTFEDVLRGYPGWKPSDWVFHMDEEDPADPYADAPEEEDPYVVDEEPADPYEHDENDGYGKDEHDEYEEKDGYGKDEHDKYEEKDRYGKDEHDEYEEKDRYGKDNGDKYEEKDRYGKDNGDKYEEKDRYGKDNGDKYEPRAGRTAKNSSKYAGEDSRSRYSSGGKSDEVSYGSKYSGGGKSDEESSRSKEKQKSGKRTARKY